MPEERERGEQAQVVDAGSMPVGAAELWRSSRMSKQVLKSGCGPRSPGGNRNEARFRDNWRFSPELRQSNDATRLDMSRTCCAVFPRRRTFETFWGRGLGSKLQLILAKRQKQKLSRKRQATGVDLRFELGRQGCYAAGSGRACALAPRPRKWTSRNRCRPARKGICSPWQLNGRHPANANLPGSAVLADCEAAFSPLAVSWSWRKPCLL